MIISDQDPDPTSQVIMVLDPNHDELKVSDPNQQHGVKYINLSQVIMLFW